MRHLYEIFEQFPDDSSLWKDSVLGAKKAQRKLMEMAGKSANPIYAIDLTSGEIIRIDGGAGQNKILTVTAAEFKNKTQPVQVH